MLDLNTFQLGLETNHPAPLYVSVFYSSQGNPLHPWPAKLHLPPSQFDVPWRLAGLGRGKAIYHAQNDDPFFYLVLLFCLALCAPRSRFI